MSAPRRVVSVSADLTFEKIQTISAALEKLILSQTSKLVEASDSVASDISVSRESAKVIARALEVSVPRRRS